LDFSIKILIATFIIATITGIFVIPVLKRLKIRQSEREDGPESHLTKQGTPTMGGIIMIIAVIISAIITYIYNQELAKKLIPITISAIGFGTIGFIDDYKKVVLRNTDGISPKSKMLGLLIISILYVIYLTLIVKIENYIIIPFFKININL